MKILNKIQIANRAYYAANAEKIKAQKKAVYDSDSRRVLDLKKVAKMKRDKKSTFNTVIKIQTMTQTKTSKKNIAVKIKEEKERNTRRNIEDILMMRDMGLDTDDIDSILP